jgi:hypothetical protein
MNSTSCMIHGCQARVYAPAGTQSTCREHFFRYLTWRRRRGPQMFLKYAAMTMEERDTIAAEWQKTVRVEDLPSATTHDASSR